MNFSELGLAPALVNAAQAKGYQVPTPIQVRAIPEILAKRDLMGIAATGTGKTAAFALPILHRLLERGTKARPETRALILCPTRELAAQIAQSFRSYSAGTSIHTVAIYGGVSATKQGHDLRKGADIIVATPGRLLDMMGGGFAKLTQVETLVLDEADHMLDLGFIPAVKRIVKALPHARQTMMFSATMPPAIRTLAAEMLREPVEVAVTPVSTPAADVDQKAEWVKPNEKRARLAQILNEMRPARTIVFTRTKRGADRVTQDLAAASIRAEAIHGNKGQTQREKTLAAFRSGKVPVLVATDIAARGLDISGVDLVVNFDLPEIPETYVHRIGRTGRAGASGLAIALVSAEERSLLRAIERLIKRPIAMLGVAPAEGSERAPSHPGRPQRTQQGHPRSVHAHTGPGLAAPSHRPGHGPKSGHPQKPGHAQKPGHPPKGRPPHKGRPHAAKAGPARGGEAQEHTRSRPKRRMGV